MKSIVRLSHRFQQPSKTAGSASQRCCDALRANRMAFALTAPQKIQTISNQRCFNITERTLALSFYRFAGTADNARGRRLRSESLSNYVSVNAVITQRLNNASSIRPQFCENRGLVDRLSDIDRLSDAAKRVTFNRKSPSKARRFVAK